MPRDQTIRGPATTNSNRNFQHSTPRIAPSFIILVLALPAVRNALNSFETTVADFPDCLIVAKASHDGCSHTLTFDQRMKSLPNVQLH